MTTLTNKTKSQNMKNYLQQNLHVDMEAFASNGKTETGFKNLDLITSLYPGLYIVGGISSLGKTTFVHQIADQIAQNGKPVMFFSLEQTVLELATKSLSRIIAQTQASNALTSLQICKNSEDSRVSNAINAYSVYASNLTVVECSYESTVDDIIDTVKSFIQQNKVTPVVIVDYLQAIQPSGSKHATAKDAVDFNIKMLKQLQTENKLVLIVTSSLNRQNYMTPIDYESFKESGGIEYTADVVWGLQLQALHNEIFSSQSSISQKRDVLKKAKAETPRKVELTCVKNRFGISSYSCYFDYYSAWNLFRPDMKNIHSDLTTELSADKDGFVCLPPWMEDDTPFS